MLCRQVLDSKIVLRRACLSELEIAMSAACAAAALGESPRTDATDRESWDRATWHRYLPPPCGWNRPTARACAVFARKSGNSNG
jgi:hypothetical protein